MSPRQNVAVFEAVNRSRREIYVGATTAPVFRVLKRLRMHRPPGLADWDFRARIEVRSLHFGLSKVQARLYVARFRGAAYGEGWRYLR